jgi:thiosulfate/3-mercaptopyruvate sulfurtransferase
MPFANPQYLIETDELAAQLDDPALRIYDCTVFLRRDPERGFRTESGREAWAESHIPGSGFIDLPDELSDRDADLRFMMPPAAQFESVLGPLGLGDDARVVLYDRAGSMWAARIWWMLRAMGFENAALLNGGWQKWSDEGRPVSSEAPAYPAATFHAAPRERLMAGKADVLAGIGDAASCIVNALSVEQHNGDVAPYGRAGHIAGSVNVPAVGDEGVLNPSTGAFRPAEELERLFRESGALDAGRVITYCGGGIAASSDAFLLTLLGHEDVAVYDASLSEWAADESLPMESGV